MIIIRHLTSRISRLHLHRYRHRHRHGLAQSPSLTKAHSSFFPSSCKKQETRNDHRLSCPDDLTQTKRVPSAELVPKPILSVALHMSIDSPPPRHLMVSIKASHALAIIRPSRTSELNSNRVIQPSSHNACSRGRIDG